MDWQDMFDNQTWQPKPLSCLNAVLWILSRIGVSKLVIHYYFWLIEYYSGLKGCLILELSPWTRPSTTLLFLPGFSSSNNPVYRVALQIRVSNSSWARFRITQYWVSKLRLLWITCALTHYLATVGISMATNWKVWSMEQAVKYKSRTQYYPIHKPHHFRLVSTFLEVNWTVGQRNQAVLNSSGSARLLCAQELTVRFVSCW